MDNKEKLAESKDMLESAIAQSMAIYGVSPSVGRIYSVLYFSKTPMTLKEIQDHVSMSKASVSNGVRELIETEMVSKIWKKGERQDHYIAERDFFWNFINYIVKKLRQEKNLIMKSINQAEPILEEIAESTSDNAVQKEAKEDLQLVEHSKNYLDWTMRLANAMETGEIFTNFPKKEDKRSNMDEKT